jgi:hypothetical protein
MSTVLFTIIAAFFLVLTAVGLLGIGWLLTGKSKIKPGACGRDPHKMRDEDCSSDQVSCGLCKKEENNK